MDVLHYSCYLRAEVVPFIEGHVDDVAFGDGVVQARPTRRGTRKGVSLRRKRGGRCFRCRLADGNLTD